MAPDPRRPRRRHAAVAALALAACTAAALTSCSDDEGKAPVDALRTATDRVTIPDGEGRSIEQAGGRTARIGVVTVSDDLVTLDVREGDGPTLGVQVPAGGTFALNGATIRVGGGSGSVILQQAGGKPSREPAAPHPSGPAGTPARVNGGTRGLLTLGTDRAVLGVLNAGRSAVVFSYELNGAARGIHELRSGELTTIGTHVVKVESDGRTVTFTPYG